MSRCESVRPQTASEVVSKYSKPASRMTFLALRMQSACGRSPVPMEFNDIMAAPWALAAADEDRDIAGGRAIDRDHVAAIVGQTPDRFRGGVVILEAGPPDGSGGLAHALLVRHVVRHAVVE